MVNQEVLNKYNIKFEVLLTDGRKEVNVTSGIVPYFWGYFVKKYPEFLIEEVLPEINKALLGEPFDDDAGGFYHFLKIGHTNSFFYDDQNHQYSLPTIDVKEIILSYLEWINDNNLSDYI